MGSPILESLAVQIDIAAIACTILLLGKLFWDFRSSDSDEWGEGLWGRSMNPKRSLLNQRITRRIR